MPRCCTSRSRPNSSVQPSSSFCARGPESPARGTKPLRINLPLRVRLPLLAAGTMLPPILFATALVHQNYVGDREAAFDRVLDSVRGMRLALDREMQIMTSALQVLAL